MSHCLLGFIIDKAVKNKIEKNIKLLTKKLKDKQIKS